MEVYELNYYNEFSCLMGKCPETCCKGWQINVDEETYKKYLIEPGKDGRRLRAGIEKNEDLITIKKHKGTCPFFTKEGKCSVQLAKGEEYMPDVCIIFPRFRTNYGNYAEELFFLSCPETVRLFISHIDDFCLTKVDKEVKYKPWTTNDDQDYLSELLTIRENIIKLISGTEKTDENLYYILKEYSNALQISFAEFTKHPDFSEYINCEDEFYIDAQLTDRLVTGGLYHIQLRKVAPFLHNLFKLYFKHFDKLTKEEADNHTKDLLYQLKSNCPKSNKVIRGYFKYFFYSEFMTVYEDYSFLKKIYMGIIHNHFLKLFFALYYDEYKTLSDDEMIKIIMTYERRAEHNDEVSYALYNVIEKEIIKPQIIE